MIWTFVIGAITGFIAKLIVYRQDTGGFTVMMILGVIGAMLAHLTGRGLGWYVEGAEIGILVSTVGSIIVLAIYCAVVTKNPRIHH